MSLRAKIEAVIYAAEEPVTLAQLAEVFAAELSPAAGPSEDQPGAEALIEQGFVEASHFLTPNADQDEMALLAEMEQQRESQAAPDPVAVEAEAKRAARQRERDLREKLKAIVDELIEEYAKGDRGMEIREVAGGFRIATKPEYHDAVRAFVKSLKPPMKLSLQALETLAVIAYKQPVTAPEVAEIRGVDSGGVLGGLVSRKLITTAGRKQVIGRPILYKTTREFLLRFGLKDINELPSIEEFEKLAGDIEIGEDDSVTSQLPFEDAATADHEPADLESVEANAGEPGLAVEAAEVPVVATSETAPEVVPLDAELPEPGPIAEIDITPAAHPAVPPDTAPDTLIEENDGRNS